MHNKIATTYRPSLKCNFMAIHQHNNSAPCLIYALVSSDNTLTLWCIFHCHELPLSVLCGEKRDNFCAKYQWHCADIHPFQQHQARRIGTCLFREHSHHLQHAYVLNHEFQFCARHKRDNIQPQHNWHSHYSNGTVLTDVNLLVSRTLALWEICCFVKSRAPGFGHTNTSASGHKFKWFSAYTALFQWHRAQRKLEITNYWRIATTSRVSINGTSLILHQCKNACITSLDCHFRKTLSPFTTYAAAQVHEFHYYTG